MQVYLLNVLAGLSSHSYTLVAINFVTQTSSNATFDQYINYSNVNDKNRHPLDEKARPDTTLSHSSSDSLRFFCSFSTLSSPPLLCAVVRVVVMLMWMVVVRSVAMVYRDASDCGDVQPEGAVFCDFSHFVLDCGQGPDVGGK